MLDTNGHNRLICICNDVCKKGRMCLFFVAPVQRRNVGHLFTIAKHQLLITLATIQHNVLVKVRLLREYRLRRWGSTHSETVNLRLISVSTLLKLLAGYISFIYNSTHQTTHCLQIFLGIQVLRKQRLITTAIVFRESHRFIHSDIKLYAYTNEYVLLVAYQDYHGFTRDYYRYFDNRATLFFFRGHLVRWPIMTQGDLVKEG